MRRPGSILPLVLLLAAALLTVAAIGCGGALATVDARSGHSSERDVAPTFSGVTIDGVSVSSEGYRGKPLVLVFWASW